MPKSIDLRPYQKACVTAVRECFATSDDPALVFMPTGAGKTVVMAFICAAAAEKGTNCTVVVDRVSLVDQTSALLDRYGIEHGVLKSGSQRYRPNALIQICSAQSLEARGAFPKTRLLVVDECHAVRKVTAEFIKNNRKRIKVLGLSATPFTQGLGAIYPNLVSIVTTNQLIEEGFLVPIKPYVALSPDWSGAKVVAGEWSESDIEERGMAIVGDIVSEFTDKYPKHFDHIPKSIVFSVTVGHGDELCRQFQAAGYNFQQISYRDSEEHRRALIEEFRKPNSQIHGLISCEALTKGFDVGDIECGIAARPYRKSLSGHIQQLGRVMRTAPGKKFALWLDHCGNLMRFKRDTEDVFANGLKSISTESLDSKVRKEPEAKEREDWCCRECGYLMPPAATACPACGKEHRRQCKVETRSGVMVEVGISDQPATTPSYLADRHSVWMQLCGFAAEKKKGDHAAARKFALAQFKNLYGTWPKDDYIFNGAPIGEELRKMVMHHIIRHAKAKGVNRAVR